MKLLIIHHDPLSNQILPQTGSSIRTQHLSEGLQHRISDVELHWLCKANIEGNWRQHIHQHLHTQQWDAILCTQMDHHSGKAREDVLDTPSGYGMLGECNRGLSYDPGDSVKVSFDCCRDL